MKKTVCVVGGGASGMTAAIAAGRAGAQVTLLEHTDRVGKKILLTGNGKCNLTNLQMDSSAYTEADGAFLVREVLSQFDEKDLTAFLESLGMRLKIGREGFVYPAAESAATVVNVLRRALREAGVFCKTGVEIRKIRKEDRFIVDTDEKSERADCLILACGGKSYPKTGSDGSGYLLAKQMGLKLNRDYPALTAFVCRREGLKTLAGLRADGCITLWIDGEKAVSETGQLQFTDYGISGIPVFQLSIPASKALSEGKQVKILVNLFPGMTKEKVLSLLQTQIKQYGNQAFDEAMTGFLHKKWIDYFGKQYDMRRFARAEDIPAPILGGFAKELCALAFPVERVRGYDFCQVTGGGVDTNEVDGHLQSVQIPGLYVVGEMLDVVGKCGGYNLQWAFSTGYLAGIHAAGVEGIVRKEIK